MPAHDTSLLVTTLSRTEVLTLLPPGGVVAEIGVHRGAFSRQILRRARPTTLHLIDPWACDAKPNAQYSIDTMLDAYATVQSSLVREIAGGQVVLHRTYSTAAATEFPDEMFDWIYLDAMHDYENVLADLRAFAPKVKSDGFILGHDFSVYRSQRTFGVVPAVREFVAQEAFQIMLITNETNPSFLLARRDNDTTAPALRSALLDVDHVAIAFDASLLKHFTQVRVMRSDSPTWLVRFGTQG